MISIDPQSPQFLELVKRCVIRASVKTGRPVGVRWLAKRMGVPEEDVEAAMIHLVSKKEIGWTKRKKPPQKKLTDD